MPLAVRVFEYQHDILRRVWHVVIAFGFHELRVVSRPGLFVTDRTIERH